MLNQINTVVEVEKRGAGIERVNFELKIEKFTLVFTLNRKIAQDDA
jgi:hypothetical protein